MTKGTRRRLTQVPYKQHGGGIHEDGWAGDLNFVWAGSPFHVRRLWLPQTMDMMPKPPMAMLATKSDEALANLFKAGLRFAVNRKNTLKTEIHVVNGINYPRPKQTWADLILPEDIKSQIRDGFESFLESKQRYRDLGLPYRRGFLLVGPPGNGKTLVTKVIAGSYKVNIVTLKLKSDLEEGVVDKAFALARTNPPCVLLLEDLDKMINNTRVSLSYLLNKLDGMDAPEGVLVIATTNEPGRLDPALLHRPSRFDRIWEFKLPEEPERLSLLRLRGGKYFSEAGLIAAAAASAGFSMAYVQEAVVSALMLAVHEKAPPQDEHLAEALRQLKGQIRTAVNGTKVIGAGHDVGFTLHGDTHAR